jgi:serine/threonine protein kinase
MSESIGVVDNWEQTDTSGLSGSSADLSTPNLSTLAEPTFQLLKTSSDFIRILQALSVEGPLLLAQNLIAESFIGAGGQFSVYQNWTGGQNLTVPWDLSPVAVKRCNIVLGGDQEVNLTSDKTRRQVHDMFLEVLVLRDPVLKSHRNIVHLLGWSFESGYNGMPLLVMELATEGNLKQVLTEKIQSDACDIMHHLCLDMAAGLDAIHRAGIIHADFKPENILVFQNESKDVPFIAKLSDFGYSVPEAEAQNESKIYVTALSNGWQAPEIKLTRPPTAIATDDYKKADIYSLGMVVWSTWCFHGRPPVVIDHTNAIEEALKMLSDLPTISETLRNTLNSALSQLLRLEPPQRTDYALELFKDGSVASKQW